MKLGFIFDIKKGIEGGGKAVMTINNTEKRLSDIIEDLSKCFKPQNAQKEIFEALNSFFKNYYGGKDQEGYQCSKNITMVSIKDILANQEGFEYGLFYGIKSYPNDKYALIIRIEKLIEHLNRYYYFKIETRFLNNFKYRDRSERLLKMLRYLHDGEKSRAQIAEDFGISERALASDLKELIDGFSFMDSIMSIKDLERGKNIYRSIIHPIFLSLNSSEIYSATVGLKLLSEGTVFEKTLGRIADGVYMQLSNHAKQMLEPHLLKEDISFREDDLKFINTMALLDKDEKSFTYFLKEPIECEITYIQNDERLIEVGTISLTEISSDRRFDYY
jgi:hypothetical protein